MSMDESELKEVLRLHKLWLEGDANGKCADLSGADLSRFDLNGVNLSKANLHGAYLPWSSLCNANLREADLSGVNLRNADLYMADLSGANLSGADLRRANLCRANLSRTNLNGARCGFDAFFGSANGAPIYQAVCGFGRRNAALTLLAQGERKDWRWFTGCFVGSEAKLRRAVARDHGNSKAGRGYLLAIDYLVSQAENNANTCNAK